MDLGLKNKIVIITGATGGIGSSICRGFLAEESILVPFFRNPTKIEKLKENLSELISQEQQFYPMQVDLSDEGQVKAGVKKVIQEFGRIDVLVNGAGSATELPFLMFDEAMWEKEITNNLHSTARLIRLVAKEMFKSKGGSIINITSLLSHRFGRGAVPYSVAKAAIDRLSESLAQELGQRNVRINSICPGVIETKMSTGLVNRSDGYINEFTALKRLGQPEDVTNAALFLASDRVASFITGHKLHVDGGLSL